MWRTLFRVRRWSDEECTDHFGHVTVYNYYITKTSEKSTGSPSKVRIYLYLIVSQ